MEWAELQSTRWIASFSTQCSASTSIPHDARCQQMKPVSYIRKEPRICRFSPKSWGSSQL